MRDGTYLGPSKTVLASLFALSGQSFVLFPYLLRRLGPHNDLQVLLLEPFDANAVIDGPLVRIDENLTEKWTLKKPNTRITGRLETNSPS